MYSTHNTETDLPFFPSESPLRSKLLPVVNNATRTTPGRSPPLENRVEREERKNGGDRGNNTWHTRIGPTSRHRNRRRDSFSRFVARYGDAVRKRRRKPLDSPCFNREPSLSSWPAGHRVTKSLPTWIYRVYGKWRIFSMENFTSQNVGYRPWVAEHLRSNGNL